jgi:hypothetical protein
MELLYCYDPDVVKSESPILLNLLRECLSLHFGEIAVDYGAPEALLCQLKEPMERMFPNQFLLSLAY